MFKLLLWAVLLFISVTLTAGNPEKKTDRLRQLPFNEVKLTEGFWKDKIEVTRKVTVPLMLHHAQHPLKCTQMCTDYRLGRSNVKPPRGSGNAFLFTALESAAYELSYQPDPELEAFIDNAAAVVSASMLEDGYMSIAHICQNTWTRNQGDKPYSKIIHSHELYTCGLLYEAAAAYYTATGKDNLLKVAEKSARHVNQVIFEGGNPDYNDGKPIMQAPGHQEIEIGLYRLYQATGNPLYLDMSRKFLDIRGVTFRPELSGTSAPEYAQQHLPVAKQRTAVGHGVRAGYLYTAMAANDLLAGTSDYHKALTSIWKNMVSKKMSITGGLGAIHNIEGFGENYHLPNKDAYNETCASVANVFFNYKMFETDHDADYLDILELCLYNNVMAGVGLNGEGFTYENPLESDGIRLFNKEGGIKRAEWLGCPCCPPNVTRLLMKASGYMYSYDTDRIYVNLYAGNETEISMSEGKVHLRQETLYPHEGDIRLEINPEKDGQDFSIYLRIPTWAEGKHFIPGNLYTYENKIDDQVKIKVNDTLTRCKREKGFAVIGRAWKKGDVITLHLPMQPRWVSCNNKVKENRNRLSVTRGPLLYCAEGADHDGAQMQRFFLGNGLPEISIQEIQEGLCQGIRQLTCPARFHEGKKNTAKNLNFIPYYAWNNRSQGNTMVVWIPQNEATAVSSIPGYGYKDRIKDVKVSSNSTHFDPIAVCDGGKGACSAEIRTPYWASKGMDGTPEEVIVEFNSTQEFNGLGVWWIDRSNGKETDWKHITQVPESWNVEYRTGKEWHALEVKRKGKAELNCFNEIKAKQGPVSCDAIKIIIHPHEGYIAGIGEIRFHLQ